MHNYIHLLPGGKKTRNGEMYYEEFKTEFWKKQGKYYLFPFIYLNFTKCNLKFPNNILETEYDRMRRANQAAQAMLSLSSGPNFTNSAAQGHNNNTTDSTSRRMEENIRQNVSNQEDDEEEFGNNQNQNINNQGEDEEGYFDFEEENNNEEEYIYIKN
jgi:hypothetical protein